MEYSITDLIEHFRKRSKDTLGVTPREIAYALSEGVKVSPEKFPEFVEAYQDFMDRIYPNSNTTQRRSIVLDNIAAYALIADCGYEQLCAEGAFSKRGGRRYIMDMYDNPERYGPVMQALSCYLGAEGNNLTVLVMNASERNFEHNSKHNP